MPPEALLRVLRYFGAAIVVTAPVTGALVWSEGEKTMALVVFGGKLYVGLFAAWGLPWILRRLAKAS